MTVPLEVTVWVEWYSILQDPGVVSLHLLQVSSPKKHALVYGYHVTACHRRRPVKRRELKKNLTMYV
jgi:hypothetical protein